jgi:hypothetical protein
MTNKISFIMAARLLLNDLKHLLTEAQKDIDDVKYLHKFNKDPIFAKPISYNIDSVNGGLKVSNSGGIKLSTCQSLGLKPRGHVDDRCGGVPHVARFVQQRFEHQRDRQTDWTQPGNGAEVSEFTGPSIDPEEIQEAKQTGWPQGIHNRSTQRMPSFC